MSELDMIFEQLRTIAADIATMQEALGLLVEALHPPPTAPVVEEPAIATYTQMYGQVETPKEAVQPLPKPPPGASARVWRWFLKDGTP